MKLGAVTGSILCSPPSLSTAVRSRARVEALRAVRSLNFYFHRLSSDLTSYYGEVLLTTPLLYVDT